MTKTTIQAIVQAEVPKSHDVYSLLRENGIFAEADTSEKREWLLLSLQQQAEESMKNLMTPELKRAIRTQVYDQMCIELKKNVLMSELNNYINTLLAFGIPEAVVLFDTLVHDSTMKHRSLKKKLNRLLNTHSQKK